MKKISRSRLGRRFTALLLSLALVLTAIPFAGATVTQEQIDKKKAQQEELQDDIDSLESSIDALKDKENSAVERIQLYQQQLDALVGQINASQELIAALEEQIAQTQAELAEAQTKATEYYQLFCERVRDLEETGSLSYWSILFDAASFSDLLDRIHFISDVVRYDNSMVDALDAARQDVADKEAQLKEEKSAQETALADLESQQDAVEIATANTEALLDEIQANQEKYADQLKKLEDEAKELADDIVSDEKELKRIQEQIAQDTNNNNNNNSGNGGSSNNGGGSATPAPPISDSGLAASIVAYAYSFVGKLPYVWGGTSLVYGADCSGFVQQIYKAYGIYLPRTSVEQSKCGYAVPYSEAQPGDLIFYYTSSGSHIGIYCGDGKFINAVGTGKGTQVSYCNPNKSGFTVRRVI